MGTLSVDQEYSGPFHIIANFSNNITELNQLKICRFNNKKSYKKTFHQVSLNKSLHSSCTNHVKLFNFDYFISCLCNYLVVYLYFLYTKS